MMVKKVNICGVKYDVEAAKDTFKADACHFGEIHYPTAKILISDELPDDLANLTLCHEIMHGILTNMGRTDLDTEEFVQQMAVALNLSFIVRECE